jgi:hypothetical protein
MAQLCSAVTPSFSQYNLDSMAQLCSEVTAYCSRFFNWYYIAPTTAVFMSWSVLDPFHAFCILSDDVVCPSLLLVSILYSDVAGDTQHRHWKCKMLLYTSTVMYWVNTETVLYYITVAYRYISSWHLIGPLRLQSQSWPCLLSNKRQGASYVQ